MASLKQFDSTVTQTDLINVALSYLNQPEIASIDEKSTAARLMKLHWPLSIRSLLSQANWSFALNRKAGQRLSEEETAEKQALYPEYPCCFGFPPNLIRLAGLYTVEGKPLYATAERVLRRIGSAPITQPLYRIIGNKVRTELEELIFEYVKYTDNINVFPTSFMICLTYDLAARGAKTLVNSASYAQQMQQNLAQELTLAMNRDASQQIGEYAY